MYNIYIYIYTHIHRPLSSSSQRAGAQPRQPSGGTTVSFKISLAIDCAYIMQHYTTLYIFRQSCLLVQVTTVSFQNFKSFFAA